MVDARSEGQALRLDTVRALKRSRVLDDALRSRWLQLVPAMSTLQLQELRSALEETEARIDALDDARTKR